MSAATPGLLRIPAPTTEIFAMSRVADVALGARPRRASRSSTGSARGELVLGQRERDVGVALGRGVLHDRVDVDPGVGERAEHASGDAGPVGHARGS